MTRLRALWCKLTHGKPYHPICGVYRCRKCLRTYPVPWGGIPKPRPLGVQ